MSDSKKSGKGNFLKDRNCELSGKERSGADNSGHRRSFQRLGGDPRGTSAEGNRRRARGPSSTRLNYREKNLRE